MLGSASGLTCHDSIAMTEYEVIALKGYSAVMYTGIPLRHNDIHDNE
jgi:hypothetical protein